MISVLMYTLLLLFLPMTLYVAFLLSSRAWTKMGTSIWTKIVEAEKTREPLDPKRLEEAESILMQLEMSKEFIDSLGEYYQDNILEKLFDIQECWKTAKNLPLIASYIKSIVLGYLYLLELKLKGINNV